MNYPTWICHDCGIKHGRGISEKHFTTYHNGKCDVCKEDKPVTEPRDYGHLKSGWENDGIQKTTKA